MLLSNTSCAYAIPSVKDFTKIQWALGSNPGGVYTKDNKQYYLKFSAMQCNRHNQNITVEQGEAIAKRESSL